MLWGVILLTGTLCFGLGTLAGREEGSKGDGFWIEQLPPEELGIAATTSAADPAPVSASVAPSVFQPAAAAASAPQAGNYVASKTGSKYYLPTCASAKRIKDENKVWFATKEAAEKAGYQPSAACKGL